MADHRITDFVDQSAIDGLVKLKSEMQSVKDAYVSVAAELLKGMKVRVDGLDQLEAMTTKITNLQGQAAAASQKHAEALEEQNRIAARTTATIAQQLQETEKANRATRQSAVDQEKIRSVIEKVNGSYETKIQRLVQTDHAIKAHNEGIKKLEQQYAKGQISSDKYNETMVRLTTSLRELKMTKQQLTADLKNEEKAMSAVEGSYNALSQQLETLKKAYKSLNEDERNSEFGKEMLASINQLDTELKHQAESMGEHQRNVGDYAIAVRDGSVSIKELNEVLDMNAGTIAGCIEQNKELEKAKLNLNTADEGYSETLARINQKIEENKQRILDVDGIMNKQATTVAEAEEQNKQLAEALKLIDVTSVGAQQRIAQLNAKIAQNKQLIESTTPALRDNAKASESLADKLLSTMGVNNKFGSSFVSLGKSAASGGNILEGLGMKVSAFGKTAMSLLSNPLMLAFIGLTGVVAGVKWWYDYNKGLIEATRLTKDFTGKSGDDMKGFRSEVKAVADMFDKDFKEVLNATDKMASQLGITYEESLNAIKDGFLANADAQGNFLAQVDKFSPALRDAGLSARELVALISQTRSGIFSEDGLKAIQVASDRIKRMPNNTKEALQALGMSTQEIQKSLADGTKSMMDVIREVSAKLQEFPQNSEEYGDAIFNVFGRKAAAGGALLIETLADIDTNLDKEKEKMGSLAKVQEEQMQSQIELEKTLAAAFGMSDTSFEELIATAKTFINKGLVVMIRGLVDVVNWFVRMYNQSVIVRAGFNAIIASFKNLWDICKFVVEHIVISFKALGDAIEGILTLDVGKVVAGYKRAMDALTANVGNLVKNLAKNTGEAFQQSLQSELSEININLDDSIVTGPTGAGGSRGGKHHTTDSELKQANQQAEKLRKMKEKEAKEEIKRLNDLEEAKVKAMDEGHEKELAKIRLNYNKKIREITGDSEKEKQARKELVEAMVKELNECETKYQQQMSSTNLSNKLAAVKKGSKEELDLKLEQLEANRNKELEEAKKNGADITLIEQKFNQQRKELKEEYANEQMKLVQETAAAETVVAENAYNKQLAALQKKYAEDLLAAKDNQQKREKIQLDYENNVAKLSENYAKDSAQAQIKMYEDLLKIENLTDKERADLELELAKAKIALETAVADETLAQNQRILDDDQRLRDKRMENAQTWLQYASEALNSINELTGAIFDNKINKIEEELEATKSAGEEEKEHLSELVEKKVITQEEGEARKRAAEAKTARKEEELEKKKQSLEYRKAVWDKANKLAQTSISTALGIMQTIAQVGFPAAIPLVATVGAIGAINLATILATPIPKYAKGTDYHKGGLAVVGDGGRKEIVSFGGEMYITPDKPTLIDMPRGAEVIPDADRIINNLDILSPGKSADLPKVIVNNDYTDLQRELVNISYLIKKQTRSQQRSAARNDLLAYKALRDL